MDTIPSEVQNSGLLAKSGEKAGKSGRPESGNRKAMSGARGKGT